MNLAVLVGERPRTHAGSGSRSSPGCSIASSSSSGCGGSARAFGSSRLLLVLVAACGVSIAAGADPLLHLLTRAHGGPCRCRARLLSLALS